MNCELADTTVHGYFDGELDAERSAEFERHLERCAQCQAALEGIESLSKRLQQASLYEPASAALRERIHQQLGSRTDAARRQPWSFKAWFLIPASAVLATAAFLVALFLVQTHAGTERITAELIDAHVRALQPGHLTDVQSTDQHTVKPWFDGKLDFIPPVNDFSDHGFTLVGGRLDVLEGRNVAALVYSRRKHLISVFIWPSADKPRDFTGSGSKRGYNWITWKSGDMQFYLVSDVSPADLTTLKSLIG